MEISLPIRIKLFWKKLKVSWRFHFAHHPLCDNYGDQVFKIKGIYLCQGCTLTYIGIILGVMSSFALTLSLSNLEWSIIGIGILISLFIIEFLKLNKRIIKRLIRFVTGLGLGGFFWVLISSTNIIAPVIALLLSFIGYKVFKIIRSSQLKEDKCLHCSEFKQGKICSGLALEAKANREYSEYATLLMQDQLKARVLSKYRNIALKEVKIPQEEEKPE